MADDLGKSKSCASQVEFLVYADSTRTRANIRERLSTLCSGETGFMRNGSILGVQRETGEHAVSFPNRIQKAFKRDTETAR